MNRRILLVSLVALAAALAVFVGSGFSPSDGGGTSTTAAEAVDVPVTYADGSTGNLTDFRGTPVVLNFWASWCPACVAEMPDFELIHQELGDQVVFIGMNMQESDPSSAAALIEQTGVTYAIATDPDGAIYREFGGIAMPTTVFIGADGAVADVHAGALFADDLRDIIDEQLLGA